MSKLLLSFEELSGLGAKGAAKLLDCPTPTYYQWRRGAKMPPVVERFVRVLMRLTDDQLEDLIREYVNGRDDEEL